MKKARLSIITENQTQKNKAEKVAKLISQTLLAEPTIEIHKYDKFDNSYKLDFIIRLVNSENSIVESLEKTNRICSPWIVTFHQNKKEVELIFNKVQSSTFTKNEFNVIVWGHWLIE